MNIALIRNGFVENVITANDLAFAQSLGYDAALQVTPANRVAGGWSINGTVYPDKPLTTEVANLRTLEQQADAAIAANIQANADATAWLAANSGANLTTTVLTTGLKNVMQALMRTNNQMDAVIRLLRGKFDSTT